MQLELISLLPNLSIRKILNFETVKKSDLLSIKYRLYNIKAVLNVIRQQIRFVVYL